jgi:hypothetical protein
MDGALRVLATLRSISFNEVVEFDYSSEERIKASGFTVVVSHISISTGFYL